MRAVHDEPGGVGTASVWARVGLAVGLLLAYLASTSCAAPPRADELVVVADHLADSHQPLLGYLARPDKLGRLPAVVVLHGCDGFHWNVAAWAARLRSWGFVALAIDSLTPRHIDNGCVGGPNDSATDAFAALRYLQAQYFVRPDRVGVLGFSRGGGAALLDVDAGGIAGLYPTRFRAAVAYYPMCQDITGRMVAPTLILAGEKDDWLPSQACRDLLARRAATSASITLQVYAGATHAFNIDAPSRVYLGHHLRFDPMATQDAEARTRAFLEAHLMAPRDTKETTP